MYTNAYNRNNYDTRPTAAKPAIKKTRVLFVCMGNLCRSPIAEGVFSKMVKDHNLDEHFIIDSAGTNPKYMGEAPDVRSQQVAKGRGIELDHIRARRIDSSDFENFDFIMAMDTKTYIKLLATNQHGQRNKVKHFLDYAPELNTRDMPDPYYGGKSSFEAVIKMIEAAAWGFFKHSQQITSVQKPLSYYQ